MRVARPALIGACVISSACNALAGLDHLEVRADDDPNAAEPSGPSADGGPERTTGRDGAWADGDGPTAPCVLAPGRTTWLCQDFERPLPSALSLEIAPASAGHTGIDARNGSGQLGIFLGSVESARTHAYARFDAPGPPGPLAMRFRFDGSDLERAAGQVPVAALRSADGLQRVELWFMLQPNFMPYTWSLAITTVRPPNEPLGTSGSLALLQSSGELCVSLAYDGSELRAFIGREQRLKTPIAGLALTGVDLGFVWTQGMVTPAVGAWGVGMWFDDLVVGPDYLPCP